MQHGEVETYHPVYARPSDSWYPANRTADLLIHFEHIWGDIIKLNEIRLSHKSDEVANRLLLKHMLVEFRSLLDPLKEIQAAVMRAPALVVGRPAPMRYVTKRQREACRIAFKAFWRAVRAVERDLFDIRNEIGAHRGSASWQEIEELWEKLDADRFTAAMNAFLPVWDSLKGLNIYEWSRSFGDGCLAVLGGAILHDWEDAYGEDELQQQDAADG